MVQSKIDKLKIKVFETARAEMGKEVALEVADKIKTLLKKKSSLI